MMRSFVAIETTSLCTVYSPLWNYMNMIDQLIKENQMVTSVRMVRKFVKK